MSRLLFVVCALLTGCGPLMAIVPRGGQPAAATATAGVQLTVHAAQWDAYPSDLPERAHAVFVEIYNAAPYPVRVALSDFFLVEDTGQASRPLPGAVFASLQPSIMDPGELRLAFRGHGWGGFRGGWRSRSTRSTHYRSPVRHSWNTRRVYRTNYWRAHHWNHWAHAPYAYYRLGRAYRFRPYIVAPVAVGVYGPDALALAEGMLEPGGRVAGFLYFPHPLGAIEQGLQLGWDVVAEAPPPPVPQAPPPDIDDENAPDPVPSPPQQPSLVGLGRLQLPLESINLR